MTLKTKSFDIAEHLTTPEEIRDFLKEVATTGDESDFIHALNTAVKAVGMTKVAKKTGVSRVNLSKSLAEDGDPDFTVISKVTKALGCKLSVV